MSAGIYVITNKTNGKYYVGQSSNIERRIQAHKYWLRAGKHHNAYLQAAWAKYGEDAFRFEVVEMCAADDMTAREMEWVSFFRSGGLYNIATVEAPMLGRRHTAEAIAKMKVPKPEGWAAKISAALKGRKHSAEHARKTGLVKQKPVHLVGTDVWYPSITAAAQAIGVHPFNLGAHLNGRSKTCRGRVFAFGLPPQKNVTEDA
jgi:group I intron endonuclease